MNKSAFQFWRDFKCRSGIECVAALCLMRNREPAPKKGIQKGQGQADHPSDPLMGKMLYT
jgi:hypothetical protein